MRRFQKQQTTSTQVRIIRTIGSQEEASNIMDFFFSFQIIHTKCCLCEIHIHELALTGR